MVNLFYKITLIQLMIYNIGFGIVYIPNLQFPRIIKIARIFKIHMHTDIPVDIT